MTSTSTEIDLRLAAIEIEFALLDSMNLSISELSSARKLLFMEMRYLLTLTSLNLVTHNT